MSKYILVGVLFLVGCSDIQIAGPVDESTGKTIRERTDSALLFCLDGVQYWEISGKGFSGLAVRLNREGKVVVCD